MSTCIAFAAIRPAAAQQVLLYAADYGEFYDAQFDFHTLQFDNFGRGWTQMVALVGGDG